LQSIAFARLPPDGEIRAVGTGRVHNGRDIRTSRLSVECAPQGFAVGPSYHRSSGRQWQLGILALRARDGWRRDDEDVGLCRRNGLSRIFVAK